MKLHGLLGTSQHDEAVGQPWRTYSADRLNHTQICSDDRLNCMRLVHVDVMLAIRGQSSPLTQAGTVRDMVMRHHHVHGTGLEQ